MIRSAIVLTLAICMSASLSDAQDEKKKKKGQNRAGRQVATRMMARFKNVDLTDEQKSKMQEILKKHMGKLQELRKEMSSVITPEMRKARAEAGKKARAEGLKGKELRTAVEKAVEVPAEAAGKMKELQKKMTAAQKDIQAALAEVLTDEQKEKLPKRGGNRPGKGKGKKKKKNADK